MASLWRETGRPWGQGLLLVLAAATLGVGLSLPVITLRSGLSEDAYSVPGGIADLARSGQVLLALIVLSFSVLFPIVKLATLARVLFLTLDDERRVRYVRSLERLGRWSMLDVFVIAILIGSVHLGVLSEAGAEPGIYVFGAGILLSMLATRSVLHLLGSREAERPSRLPLSTRFERWRSLAALLAFALGLCLPLMVVEKFRFWDHEYSVLDASRRMFADGEAVLGAAVLAFVVVLPLAHLASLVLLRWARRPERHARLVFELEKWAMLDVFGLALLVVLAKIGAVASVETRAGLWVLLGAAALSLADSWNLRRRVSAAPGAPGRP